MGSASTPSAVFRAVRPTREKKQIKQFVQLKLSLSTGALTMNFFSRLSYIGMILPFFPLKHLKPLLLFYSCM
jgi:hypothetical protein